MNDAINLFTPHLPHGTELIIEETDCLLIRKYLIRVIYTRNRRKLGKLAKTDTLPTCENELFYGLLRQVVMNEEQTQRAFRRMREKEETAKKQAFIWNDPNLTYGAIL